MSKINLDKYFFEFDEKFKDLQEINAEWYESNLNIKAFCSKAKTKDSKNDFSEEYIRARFTYALVHSGIYDKEYICIEFGFPKGNGGKSLNPDIVVFKNKDWLKDYEEAKANKNFTKIRKNVLVIFETKKNNKSVENAIENQLRSAMELNTSDDRIFGIYFDDKKDVLIFKKSGNSEIRRYNENNELQQDGLIGWNLDKRDSLIDLPSQKDLIENNESIADVQKLKTDFLDAIDETNFTEILNTIKRENDKIKPETYPIHLLVVEFLTLKVFDEKRSKKNNNYLRFFITQEEKKHKIIDFRNRIEKLYQDAEKEYSNVLSGGRRLFKFDKQGRAEKSNDEKFLIALVEIFQKRAILKAKNESFNQIIFNNFGSDKQKAEKGQFFTPVPVVNAIIRILNPIKDEELCDPCCGICDFPAMAFRHSHRKDPEYPPNASNFYGFDLENDNLKLAELNLVLNGDGGAVLHTMDSLAQKMLKNGQILEYGKFHSKNYDENWNHKTDSSQDLKKFKMIATNPPFGKGRDLKTGKDGKWDLSKETMELYETWKAKKDENDKGLPNSMDMGVLFLENAYKLLEEGGRMAIVLSNSIASIKEWQNCRRWFLERMRLVATFDLPSNTFGETGVATTVLIAYKPKESEQKLLTNDYEVFVKEIMNLGYEVKTEQRTVKFQPTYIINEDTFETTSNLLEDFTNLQNEFKEFLKRQESEIKEAFHLELMD
jgi:type I restriction enzyme M protein